MISEVKSGGNVTPDMKTTANKNKTILIRGCDPVMAARAGEFLPPLLGFPSLISCTDDDDFIAKLKSQKWDIIFFAPGACRWSAQKAPIPGGNKSTKGWGLVEYRELVKETQGEGAIIIETVEEKNIVPLLLDALNKVSSR